MLTTLFVLTSDISGLSRVDPSAFTDQQMMELFFNPTIPRAARMAIGGIDKDACTWYNVTCDASHHIIEVNWYSVNVSVSGFISFPMMPRHMKSLQLIEQDMNGEIDTSNLPESLVFFSLEACLFTGTLDLGSLPRGMEIFAVADNMISGIVHVCNLPPLLKTLIVEERVQKNGPIHIGKLPESLTKVRLRLGRSVEFDCADADDRKWFS